MEYISITSPSACYNVEKILEISRGQGNHKNYRVQWAPSWVSGIHLMGCETLIKQFISEKEKDDTDVTQDTSEDVKQEDGESYLSHDEVQSTSEEIDIFIGQVEENDTDGQQSSQDECVASKEPSEDKDDNSIDESMIQPTMVGTNMMCNTIKIKEEDCFVPSNENESDANQEIFEDDMVDDSCEVNSKTSRTKENNSTDIHLHLNEENISTSVPTNSKHDWNNTGIEPRKRSLNFNVGFAHLSYTGNDTNKPSTISLSKETKHTVSQEMNRMSTNHINHTNILQKNNYNSLNQIVSHNSTNTNSETDFSTCSGNTSQTKDNITQNKDCIDSSNDIAPFLQHPSRSLVNSIGTDGSLQHRKRKLIETNKNTSTSTKYQIDCSVKTDIGKLCGRNEWIDTNTYKDTSAYTSYPCNSVENSTSSPLTNGTEQAADHMNSTERDVNRNSNPIDNVNILGDNGMFETPVVNQHGEQSSDTGSSIILALDPFNACVVGCKVPPSNNTNVTPFSVQDDAKSGPIYFQGSSMETPLKTLKRNTCVSGYNNESKISRMSGDASNCRKNGDGNNSTTTTTTTTSYLQGTVQAVPVFYTSTSSGIKKPKEADFCCDNCSKTKGNALTNTQVLHCKFCTKKFRCHTRWEKHEKTHGGKLPSQCEYCMKKFNYMCNMKTHIRRVHTRERPFKCTLCTKRCSTTSDLKTHLRVHDEVRPFKCPLCSKHFKQSATLQQHIRRCNLTQVRSLPDI